MFTAIIISAVTLLVSVSIHLFNISVLADRVIAYHDRVWSKTPVLVFIAISSQLLLAVVFAVAYKAGLFLDLGDFTQPASSGYIFYFSLTTITTLGLGSIEPTGHLRMLAGVESATGFLLISCSASKVFQTM